jgi:hypothetical protein
MAVSNRAKRNATSDTDATRKGSQRRKQFGARKQLQFQQCLVESQRELRMDLGSILNPEPHSYSV